MNPGPDSKSPLPAGARSEPQRRLSLSEDSARLLVEGLQDYAVFVLDPEGRVMSWNRGAERIKGYGADEIRGQHFSRFYTPEDLTAAKPQRELEQAASQGRVEDEGWRVRKDGSRFWANVVITALRDEEGQLLGFSKVTRDLSERRRAEEQLERNELRFRLLADRAPAGIYQLEPDSGAFFANAEIYAQAGLPPGSSREELRSRLHPEDSARVLASFTLALQGLADFDQEYRYLHPDGRQVWVHAQGAAVKEPDGRISSFIIVSEDITRRRGAEEGLRQSEERFRALAESASDAIISADSRGRIVYWNGAAATIFGHSAQEALGQAVALIIPEDFRSAHGAGMARYVATGEAHVIGRTVELQGLHKNGHRFPVELSLSTWTQGGEPYFTALIRDVSARKREEAQLRSAETRRAVEAERASSYRQLQELKDALDEHAIVAITDAKGRITYVNDKFCAIAKFSREELLGQDHRIINSGHHPKSFIKGLWDTITAGRVWKGEIKNRAKDGSHYWVDTTIVPFRGEDGRPSQFIAIRADITAHMEAQEQIRGLNAELEARVAARTDALTEANKELEAFAYSVSHDLRAPLRHIDGFVGLLKSSLGEAPDAKSRRYIDVISASAKQMGALIDDLLAFSRMGRAEVNKVDFDLAPLMARVVEELAPEAAGRQVQWRFGELPVIHGDPALVRLALLNLLDNALKFTRHADPACIEVTTERRPGELVLRVQDNGAGFDMQYASKLFGVFQRLHRQDEFEGTGIGLANVARIAQKHGGRVYAEGAVGRGATFHLVLPHAHGAEHA